MLQFDKRGSGDSGGDWRSASFQTLAADVLAGRQLLAGDPSVDHRLVGLAGFSQAGWIAAKAVQQDSSVPFVLLLGAAGAALTVPEQNDYFTANALRCAGVNEEKITKVLRQSALFYQTKRNPRHAVRLRQLTDTHASDPSIAGYLMPAEIPKNSNQWFMALETDFDPLPVWMKYDGRALFALGGVDNSTPGRLAAERVRALANPAIQVVFVETAQHHGLRAKNSCAAGLASTSRFHDDYWMPVEAWIEALARRTRN